MLRNIFALILCSVSVSAGNPFATGSDVVTLNPSNWKQLEKVRCESSDLPRTTSLTPKHLVPQSPLVWFVNVCREG